MKLPNTNQINVIVLLLCVLLIFYYVTLQNNYYGLKNTFQVFQKTFNQSRLAQIFLPLAAVYMRNNTINTTHPTTTTTATAAVIVNTITRSIITTSTTGLPTTLDPAELLVERAPLPSRLNNAEFKGTITVFVFQTSHHILANVQLYLIRKLAMNLVGVELFVDAEPSQKMRDVAASHNAVLNVYPTERHKPNAGGSDRNTAVVNWAISTRAKPYLGNGSAILLLDGDVLPLSLFDATTLLNSREIVCRKHPASFARFCWIGFICIGPQLYSTIDDFNVGQVMRGSQSYDSGGRTIEYLLKYENSSFSWMKETILLNIDKKLFWGAVAIDIEWILQSFSPCDKCGPEIFVSPFNNSNAVFYHMISATSEWRFGNQGSRRQKIHDSIMNSPYGPNKTYSVSEMMESVKKVQKMELIPFFGNLTCLRVCGG